jgi:hypothetical protein
MAQEHILGEQAVDLLNRTQEIREIIEYCALDGALTTDVHNLVQSLEAPLRRQLTLDQWSREIEIEDTFIWLNLFPEPWRISEGEFLAFGVAWCNPFAPGADDPYVFLRVPPAAAFPSRDALLQQVQPVLTAKGFQLMQPDQNPYWPAWKYLGLDSFQSESGFNEDAFVTAAVEAFRMLLPSVQTIDQVLRSLPKA